MVVGMELILGRPASEELIDAIWTLVSPEVVTMLTERRGWSIDDVEAWLVVMCGKAIENCGS